MARKYTLKSRSAGPKSSIDYPAELNEQQLEAVTAGPGAMLVIAGAGSGKTRTLTYRVAYLLDQGVEAGAILLLTFTNKAAKEMLTRVESLLPSSTAGLWGGTFHSIGNRVLRRHAEELGFQRGFSIMDRTDQKDMLTAVVDETGYKVPGSEFPTATVLADVFSFAVNTGSSLENVLDRKYSHLIPFLEQMADVQKRYEARKQQANTMDFDDLLVKTVKLLREKPEVADYYQERFRYVLVDEYQDTNYVQSEFIDLFAKKYGNVMVVGDDAQSIYSWRGADFRNIMQFPQRYAEARVVRIETNYRSVPQVLEVANAAIAPNVNQFEKTLRPLRDPAAEKPAIVATRDNSDQARFVTDRIQELHGEGMDLREIAVLYRAHYHAMEVELEFMREGVPYTVTSGVRFFEQAHIKDVSAFLRFASNPVDEVSFTRMATLFDGVGKKGALKLFQKLAPKLVTAAQAGPIQWGEVFAEIKPPARAAKAWDTMSEVLDMMCFGPEDGEPLPPGDMIAQVMNVFYEDYARKKFTDFSSRLEDVAQLINFAGEYEDLDAFLSEISLLGNTDAEGGAFGAGADEGSVTLSSIHQAKGLEWKVVFVIWLADGMFPGHRSLDRPESLEEERRLFYVAITRAKDELYLCWPRIKTGRHSHWSSSGDSDAFQQPSRFLDDVPYDLLEEWEVGSAFY